MKHRPESLATAMRRTTYCWPRSLVAILEPGVSGEEGASRKEGASGEETDRGENSWPAGTGSTSGYAVVRLVLRVAGSGRFEVLADRDRISRPLSRLQPADSVA